MDDICNKLMQTITYMLMLLVQHNKIDDRIN